MLQREVGSVSLVLKELTHDGGQYRGPPEEHQERRPQLHRCPSEFTNGEESKNATDQGLILLRTREWVMGETLSS